jgi:hypothetical protein
LESYSCCKEHIPGQLTLRKYYLPNFYEETLETEGNIEGFVIWVAVDKTKDSVAHFIPDLVAGRLEFGVP